MRVTTTNCDVAGHVGDRTVGEAPAEPAFGWMMPDGTVFIACPPCVRRDASAIAAQLELSLAAAWAAHRDTQIANMNAAILVHLAGLKKVNARSA